MKDTCSSSSGSSKQSPGRLLSRAGGLRVPKGDAWEEQGAQPGGGALTRPVAASMAPCTATGGTQSCLSPCKLPRGPYRPSGGCHRHSGAMTWVSPQAGEAALLAKSRPGAVAGRYLPLEEIVYALRRNCIEAENLASSESVAHRNRVYRSVAMSYVAM